MPSIKAPPVVGRRLIAIAGVAAVLSVVVFASFGYADHEPTPHGVRIAVVAPPSVRDRVAAGLSHAAPGGFVVTRAPSAAAAADAIREQRSNGALVVSATGANRILTAGASGVSLQEVIDKALTSASEAMRRPVVLQDVAPLPANDRAGLSAYVFELGLLVPSVIGSVGLYLVGRRERLWWRVAAASLYCLLAAGLGVLMFNLVFGALTGAWAALLGFGVFGALSITLTISACQATFGLPGTGLATIVFIFVGNALSGGSNPAPLLPNVYRQISPWLPNGAIVRGARAVVYFGGHGIAQPLVCLGIWSAVAAVVLAVNDWAHLSERRLARTAAADVYATPGVTHAANKLCRRRSRRAASDQGAPNLRPRLEGDMR